MKLSLIALAAVAAALFASPAQAQQNVVTTQLDSTVVLMRGRGYVPADQPVLGTLAVGEDEEFELDLESGTEYLVVGFCDNGCTDLDLVLSDGDGDEVESDRAADDYPVILIEDQSGSFVLSVVMANCSERQCHYGVRVFRKE